MAKNLLGQTEKNCVYFAMDYEDYWIENQLLPPQPGLIDVTTRLSTLNKSSTPTNVWIQDLDLHQRSFWRQHTDVLPNCGDQAVYDFESPTYDLVAPKMRWKTTLGTLMQGTINITAWDKNKLSTESDRIIGAIHTLS